MTLTDSELLSLKSALGCWEWFEYISTAIVWIGCAGEFIAEFTSLPRTKEIERKLSRLSLIVLLVGIAGELLGTIRTSQLSGQIIANTEERAAVAAQKAGDAKASAEGAAAASPRAEASAKQANDEAGRAKESADAAANRAEETARNLGLTQHLVSARQVDNLNALIEQLKQFKGQAVTLRSYIADGEGYFLCETLYFVVLSSGMNATDECGKAYPGAPLATDIVVSGPDIQETVSLGQMISRTGRLGTVSGIKSAALTIFVGVKSPFMIQPGPVPKPVKKVTTKKQVAKP